MERRGRLLSNWGKTQLLPFLKKQKKKKKLPTQS